MITVKIIADIPHEPLSPEQSYARVENIINEVKKIHPGFVFWYGGMNKAEDRLVRFDQRNLFIDRLRLSVDQGYEHEGVSVLVTTYDDDNNPKKPGGAKIWFSPEGSFLNFDLFKPVETFGEVETFNICRAIFLSLAKAEPMTFAFVNITDKLPGKEFIDTYETDFCTFPHRKCVGWMAFVPHVVTSEQLPLAAEIIDIPGKGTVIVTVKEPFELTNMAHIRRANEIEMDMVDLDFLPLTDPSFL